MPDVKDRAADIRAYIAQLEADNASMEPHAEARWASEDIAMNRVFIARLKDELEELEKGAS